MTSLFTKVAIANSKQASKCEQAYYSVLSLLS